VTTARFHPDETIHGKPAWLAFVHQVNAERPNTFAAPNDVRDNAPRYGYSLEEYDTAQIIRAVANPDNGIRVVATTDDTAAAFRRAAATLGVHIPGGAS